MSGINDKISILNECNIFLKKMKGGKIENNESNEYITASIILITILILFFIYYLNTNDSNIINVKEVIDDKLYYNNDTDERYFKYL